MEVMTRKVDQEFLFTGMKFLMPGNFILEARSSYEEIKLKNGSVKVGTKITIIVTIEKKQLGKTEIRLSDIRANQGDR